MGIKTILPIVMLIAILVLGSAFMPQILGSVEASQSPNLSQEYKDQINATRNVNVMTITTSKFFAPILGVVIIGMAIMFLFKKKRR